MSALDAATYYELKAFYSDHLAGRDDGDTESWLAGFAEDAVLATNLLDDSSITGKARFAPKVRALDADFAAAGIQRRHETSTFVFDRNTDGTVSSRFYTTLLTTGGDGVSRVHSTSVATDLLTRTEGGWLVLSRHIRRDDLAQTEGRSAPEQPREEPS
ncbi:nuclear transport factor 2 family protein [Pseudonocardia spinosispora]|uniref:nuclear transport factor 2 family protein n=1 Tax=Pseudonocardia spinosispora TaxID=103441 RepID=UPI0004184A3F|nr:nuclear transport factor 2 family protein [Pseudonocardia spinosispora]